MNPAVANLRLALDASASAVRQAYDEAFKLDDRIAMARLSDIGRDLFHVTGHVVTRHVEPRTTPEVMS